MDANKRVKQIIDTAWADLEGVGMSRIDAAHLLAIQAVVRVGIAGEGADSLTAETKLRELRAFVDQSLEPYDHDDEGNRRVSN